MEQRKTYVLCIRADGILFSVSEFKDEESLMDAAKIIKKALSEKSEIVLVTYKLDMIESEQTIL